MKIIVLRSTRERLREALAEAGAREIGGVLMAEHVGADTFVVRDLSIQADGGTFATFVRAMHVVLGPLTRFFQATNHDYRRFNYLGEWHSHPSFSLVPSTRDDATMWKLVDDPKVGANFVVLMIVRLSTDADIEASVVAYSKPRRRECGEVVWEESRDG